VEEKAENISDKASVKKTHKKKVTETVKKLDNRVGEKNVKGKDTTASLKNLAESNDSLLNQPDKTEGMTVGKPNPAAKAEQQRASMSPPVRKGTPPAKESSTGDVNKKRPASAADGDATKEKNTKGKKKLKETGSAVVENGTAEELVVQGARKQKKDSQPSGRVPMENTGPPAVAAKRPAPGEEERKLGKKVKTVPAPALAAQGENNTGKKTPATAVSTAPSVGKKAAAVVVKQEPVATGGDSGDGGGASGGGGGDQEGDRGPESGGGPPVVRLPTYTHMIKQALAGKD
jgi:hypothetical protein